MIIFNGLLLFSIITDRDNKLEYIYNVVFLFYLNFDYILMFKNKFKFGLATCNKHI